MEAGELARRAASDLHDAAVSDGDDPRHPYEFAVKLAECRGIDVEVADPGAAILDGGHATFVATESLIIHETTGTDFERAFLVAHELGHALLGDGVDHVVFEPDPARPAEPSPIGVERVTDYGRRQRREVQMDLFARELLLPRSLMRRLHLDEGLTATDIADRMHAPFDAVAQQLLDALLLPSVEPTAALEATLPLLNPAQTAAATHRGRAYLLEAGPGTGKTQTLVARIEGLLAEGVDPRRILVLTFSNKAAGELSDRFSRQNAAATSAMWVGTFHAFGLDLVRRFHAELGLPRDPRMMDRSEAVELFERRFPSLRLRHFRNLDDPTRVIADLLTAVSRAKDEVIGPEQYARLADAMHDATTTAEEKEAAERSRELSRFYGEYESLKLKVSCIDYGDLALLPVFLLDGNQAIRDEVRQRYEHVLVDEYQDVNRAGIRLLQALKPDGQNLWAVGDAKQSIYRFRGASSFNVARFEHDDFPGGVRGRLSVNFRSRREIVDVCSAFAAGMKAAGDATPLDADRPPRGSTPELRTVNESGQQVVAIAEAIEQMRRRGFAYRDQALLCSGNERLAEIGRDLESLGVPVLFIGGLFDRREVKDLLSLLALLVDDRAAGLLRLGCLDEYRLPLSDVAAILDHLRQARTEPWFLTPDRLPVSDQGRPAIAALARTLAGFDGRSNPWKVLTTFLFDRTRMAARLATATGVADRTGAIALWQFLNFVRVQPSERGVPVRRLLDRVRRLARIGDDRDLRHPPAVAFTLDAVKLMTIHGAKGLEFPVVHVPGLNQDTFPGTSGGRPRLLPPNGMIAGAVGNALEAYRRSEGEERECLFYVAASRARERLFFYAVTRKSNGAARPISPFITSLGATVGRSEVCPAGVLAERPSASTIDLRIEGPLRFTVSQISLYASCPRRFLYTHVLGVGGKRVESDYLRMHEAVRSVVEAAVGSDAAEPDDETLCQAVADAFAKEGLTEAAAIVELREAACAMVKYFHSIRRGHKPTPPSHIRLGIGDEELTYYPDDVLELSGGGRVVRVVRTGHQRDVKKDIGAAAHQILARSADAKVVVELVFLADGVTVPLELSAKAARDGQDTLAAIFTGIRRGQFPAIASDRVCPNCPAYFFCGSIPSGSLSKKFSAAIAGRKT